ncbi:hypothetical protein DP199_02745 [Enterobacter kobei]|nr:hypothetical protein DP199_02745 [Enterobacter kobei]
MIFVHYPSRTFHGSCAESLSQVIHLITPPETGAGRIALLLSLFVESHSWFRNRFPISASSGLRRFSALICETKIKNVLHFK